MLIVLGECKFWAVSNNTSASSVTDEALRKSFKYSKRPVSYFRRETGLAPIHQIRLLHQLPASNAELIDRLKLAPYFGATDTTIDRCAV
jgi:hypothetical protein